MSDSGNGLPKPPEQQALVIWRDPRDVIRGAMQQPEFQLRIHIPIIAQCPLEKLNGTLEIQYLYADGTPVRMASFVVETQVDADVARGPLQKGSGYVALTLPKGLTYQFYLLHDQAGDKVFEFFDSYVSKPKDPPGGDAAWHPELLANGAASKMKLLFGEPSGTTLTQVDPGKPMLEQLLLECIRRKSPGIEAQDHEAAWILLAMLQGKPNDSVLWWRLVTNRCGAALGDRCRLVQELLVTLLALPAPAPALTSHTWMNSAGKGNAIDWLRDYWTMPKGSDADAVKAGTAIRDSLDEFKKQLTAIANKAEAGTGNQALAQAYLERMKVMPDPVVHAKSVFTRARGNVAPPLQLRPAMRERRPGLLGQVNYVQQSANPLAAYVPSMVELPLTWFEGKYLYSDKTAIAKAKMQVRETGTTVVLKEVSVNADGVAWAEVPAGKTYEFRFHADEPKTEIKAPEREAALIPAEADWHTKLKSGKVLEEGSTKNLLWGDPGDLNNYDSFAENPALAQLLRLALISKGLNRRKGSEEDAKGEIVTAKCLIALIYSDKASSEEKARFWREASFHRLRSVKEPDGFLVERLMALLHDRDDLKLDQLVKWVNGAGGTGNAVLWLREVLEKIGDYRTAAANGVQEAITKFGEWVDVLAAKPEKDQEVLISILNRYMAITVKARLPLRLKDAVAQIEKTWDTAIDRLRKVLDAKESMRAYTSASLRACTDVVQQTEALASRPEPNVFFYWTQVLLLYPNHTAVKGSVHKIEDVDEGPLSENGLKFAVIPNGNEREVKYKTDPNAFVLLEAARTKAKEGGDVGAGALDLAVGENKFKTDVVKWGGTHFADNDTFKGAPTLSQIASIAVRNKTTHAPEEAFHEEMTLHLYPLVLIHLLSEDDRKKVWKAIAFNRLGCCCAEKGRVIRDLLHWLDANDNPAVADAMKRLRSVGTGDEHKFLADLHGQLATHENAVKVNIEGILDAFKIDLETLKGKGDDVVSPAGKKFYEILIKGIGDVKPKIEAGIKEALQTAWGRLLTVSQAPRPEHVFRAAACKLNIHVLTKEPLVARAPEVAPELDWIELKYHHHDDAFVEEAHYVVRDDGDTKSLHEGVLHEGYAFLPMPKNAAFKYYFRRDKAFAVDPTAVCVGIGTLDVAKQEIKNLTRNAMLLKKLKKANLTWGGTTLAGSKSLYANPTVGAIACNVIREATRSPHVKTGDEPEELAKLLHPILMRQPANTMALAFVDNSELWIHVVLNRMSALLGVNGHAVSSMLWAIHQGTVRNMGNIDPVASIKRADVLKMANSLGKGNGYRWLFETTNWLIAGNATLIKNNLDAIFDAMTVEMDLLLKQGSLATAVTARKLQSPSTEAYANVMKSRLAAVKGTIQASVNSAFATLTQELNAVKNQPHVKETGTTNQANLLKQAKTVIPPRTFTIPKWIELQYLHADGKVVANAHYEVRENANVKKTGALDATHGFVYLTDVPDTINKAVFKKETLGYTLHPHVANVDAWKKPESKYNKWGNYPEVGYESHANTVNVGGFPNWGQAPQSRRVDYNQFNGMGGGNGFGWWPLQAYTLNDFRNCPSIGKFAYNACLRRSAAFSYSVMQDNVVNGTVTRRIVVDEKPESLELCSLLIQLYQDAPGPRPHDPLVWSAIVMNRVATSHHGAAPRKESLLRKAVLLELARSNPSLEELVKKLNTAGKGHAVRWLRDFYVRRADVKTGVVNQLRDILTDVRTECNSLFNFQYQQGPNWFYLSNDISDAVEDARNYCDDALNAANGSIGVQGHVNATLDPLFNKLNLLTSAHNQRPFIMDVAVNQLNTFRQPADPFPLIEPQPTPPLWNLAAANETVKVHYKTSAGADAKATHFLQPQGITTADATGEKSYVLNRPIPADSTYHFEHDEAGMVFKAECKPFANPELPAALATANYIANAVVHGPGNASGLDGKNALDWGTTHIINAAAFRKNPTLGQMLSQAVIDQMALVSSAGDVQDLTMALERLITKPVVRTDQDEWFRAAVVALGAQADHGSVLKGILLRIRKHKKMSAEDFFKLVNFAAATERNAIHWIDDQLLTPGDPGGAQARLIAILNAFDARLGELHGSPDPPVSATLKNFIQTLRAEVIAVRDDVATYVPTCFQAAKDLFEALRPPNTKYPVKRPLCLGTNVYQREKAEIFLESQQTLAQNTKQAIDLQTKQRIDNGNGITQPAYVQLSGGALNGVYGQLFRGNTDRPTGDIARTLHAFIGNTRGQSAKTLAPQLANMNNKEFVEFVEALTNPPWVKQTTQWSGGAMTSYLNPADGTLIRYKPGGDSYQRPPAPMYSIEVTHAGSGDAMFKVDPNGNAVPWGPQDVVNPYPYTPNNPDQSNKRFGDNMSKAGHRPLRY
jgi:hypothetical protein